VKRCRADDGMRLTQFSAKSEPITLSTKQTHQQSGSLEFGRRDSSFAYLLSNGSPKLREFIKLNYSKKLFFVRRNLPLRNPLTSSWRDRPGAVRARRAPIFACPPDAGAGLTAENSKSYATGTDSHDRGRCGIEDNQVFGAEFSFFVWARSEGLCQ
jgi:hypothetical protein